MQKQERKEKKVWLINRKNSSQQKLSLSQSQKLNLLDKDFKITYNK